VRAGWGRFPVSTVRGGKLKNWKTDTQSGDSAHQNFRFSGFQDFRFSSLRPPPEILRLGADGVVVGVGNVLNVPNLGPL